MSDHDRQKQWRMVLMIVVGITAALMFADVAEAAIRVQDFCAMLEGWGWNVLAAVPGGLLVIRR